MILRTIFLAAALLIFAPARGLAITAAQWQSDLQFLVSHLRSTHPNLYFHVSAQDLNAAVNDLNQRIPQLSDAQITVEMMKLVAMVGDAHTSVYSPFPILPIRFRWFSDGLFVNAAAPEYSRALGAKVIEIGNLPVKQAYDAVSTVISHENDQWVKEVSETYLGTPELLASLGVTSGPAPVRYLFQDMSGAQFEIQVSPSSSDLIWPPDSTNGIVPLWRWNYNLNYWFQYLPTTQTIYLAYNRCQQMPDLSFTDFLNQVLAFSQQQPVNHMVVDLRNNTGGDSQVFQPFLDLLSANPDLRSKVTAIIGQATISSGLMAAAPLSYQFGIPLIGEPSGGDPTSYGNNVQFTLQYSGLVVSCSTRYYVIYPGYAGNSLRPDVPVSMSSADYFARHDPSLLAALVWPAPYQAPQAIGGSLAAVNAASFGTPVSPGGLASLFGSFPGVPATPAGSMPLVTQLAGVRVEVNGVAAPLLGVWPTQINFQVPGGTAVGSAPIAVSVQGQDVATGTVQVVSSSPGIFLTDFLSLDRPGAVLTERNQLTGPTVRAGRNEVIQIFATGAGPLTQSVADGVAAPGYPLAQTMLPPRVFIGSQEAGVEFSGLGTGYVGLWQINARVPDVASITGQVPVVIVTPEGYASNAVTIWVE
jgi:uncharacterized protein (TIGR03437 family)